MSKIISALVFSSLLIVVFSYSKEFDEKFCDQSIPESKIQEFEKCDQMAPKEVCHDLVITKMVPNSVKILEKSAKCLQQLKQGTSYKDFRKVICDLNLRKQYVNCHQKLMRTQKKTETTTEVSEERVEMFRKHENCMRNAMGIKANDNESNGK